MEFSGWVESCRVLTVHTDVGEVVLDNLTDAALNWVRRLKQAFANQVAQVTLAPLSGRFAAISR